MQSQCYYRPHPKDGEGNSFTLFCQSHPRGIPHHWMGRRVPPSSLVWGGYPITGQGEPPSSLGQGSTPILGGGTSHLHLGWGTPHLDGPGQGSSPRLDLGWGTQHLDLDLGWRTPLSGPVPGIGYPTSGPGPRMGYLPPFGPGMGYPHLELAEVPPPPSGPGMGYPPIRTTEGVLATRRALCLFAFTLEDFLVLNTFVKSIQHRVLYGHNSSFSRQN